MMMIRQPVRSLAVASAVALVSPLVAGASVPAPLPLGCRLVETRSAQRALAVQIVNTTSRPLSAGAYVAWDATLASGAHRSLVVRLADPVDVGGTGDVGRILGAASSCTASTPRPVIGRAPVHY